MPKLPSVATSDCSSPEAGSTPDLFLSNVQAPGLYLTIACCESWRPTPRAERYWLGWAHILRDLQPRLTIPLYPKCALAPWKHLPFPKVQSCSSFAQNDFGPSSFTQSRSRVSSSMELPHVVSLLLLPSPFRLGSQPFFVDRWRSLSP